MVRRGRHLAAFTLVACALLSVGPASFQARDPSAAELVDRTIQYVDRYRDQLRFVLADETTVQRALRSGVVRERTTRGELFMTWLGVERRWMAVHDVAEVDGVAVPDRDTLTDLLLASPLRDVARSVLARNARFNLGGVIRNFNEPILALQMFDVGRREGIRYRRASTASVAGVPLVQLTFEERERPTLIQSAAGGPVFSRGDVWIETATGVVRSTRMQVRREPVEAELITTFEENARLGLWVPVTFTERYVAEHHGDDEIIEVSSRYTNYRRFEVTGRIK